MVLSTLENIGTCVKIAWNYFPCLVLHKVKVFIDYVQGLVQCIVTCIIVDFYIVDFIFALFIFMKDGKAVNQAGERY